MKAHSHLVSGSHPLVHSGCLRATAPSPVSARLKNQMKQAWHLRNFDKVQTGNWSSQQLVHLVPASSTSSQIFLQFQEIEISAILMEILLQIEQSIRIGLDFHFRTGLNSSLHTIIPWGPLKFINWCRILDSGYPSPTGIFFLLCTVWTIQLEYWATIRSSGFPALFFN